MSAARSPSPAMKWRRFIYCPALKRCHADACALAVYGPAQSQKSLLIIILHGLPCHGLQEPRRRLVDAREVGIADRRAAGQRRKRGAGREISSGQAWMALVRRIEIELRLLAKRAGKGKAGRNHQRVVFISGDRIGFRPVAPSSPACRHRPRT